jgi:DNA (cytosine-5)-methyltransferase 1
MNYYSEFDPGAAAWLRELIRERLIPPGDVDERSITDVAPNDLRGYRSVHLFAGIGGWPFALRLAGWPDERPVWTGSCPCQPFSAAGKRKGEADERHLWPVFRRLISECSPSVCFGEQVASKDGKQWLAGVRADLEGLGYAVGAADLCAAGVGAPHIRQRLFWVADAGHGEHGRADECEPRSRAARLRDETATHAERCGSARGVLHPAMLERHASHDGNDATERPEKPVGIRGSVGRLGDSDRGRQSFGAERDGDAQCDPADRDSPRPNSASGPPSTSSPAGTEKRGALNPEHSRWLMGYPGRVGLLRGYGNAIVPQVAAA